MVMVLWIAAVTGHIEVGGSYGAPNWHAHEMLFGFSSAVLAGFLLTAVPNWTGSLPVSGTPLVMLFGLWCAGRIVLLKPDVLGPTVSAGIDGLFLPSLLFICAREVIAGRKWKDLKVLAGLLALCLANGLFHYAALGGDYPEISVRLATGAYVLLITIVGGRIIPSFTRNWINRFGRTDFPVPYNRFDTCAILVGVMALASWSVFPDNPLTAVVATAAALFHLARLLRWRGWTIYPEKLLLILHIAYAFVPLGFGAIALGAIGLLDDYAVLHIQTVGTITVMMLAVMTRASRGHTGRPLTATRITVASYAALILAALVRPLAEMIPGAEITIYAIAGILWIAAFGLFCFEYGPMLILARRQP